MPIASYLWSCAFLLTLSGSLAPSSFCDDKKANTRIPIVVHIRLGSKPCELAQRGSLIISKQYAWVEIEGTKSETYSPEMAPGDYLSASDSISGRAAKDAQKSGFILKAEPDIVADLPHVRALQRDTSCPDLQGGMAEAAEAREHRRSELQEKLYKPGVDDVIPPIVLESSKPNLGSSKGAGLKTKSNGNVSLVVLIDTEGRVRQSKIVRSTNSELAKKAAEEVTRWKFAPARKKGVPVPSVIPIELIFDLY